MVYPTHNARRSHSFIITYLRRARENPNTLIFYVLFILGSPLPFALPGGRM